MQGLAINLGERMTPALRKATQGFTNIVSALSEFAKISSEDLLREEQINVNKLAIELTDTNTTLLRRNEIYEALQDIAPEVIENIDFENVSIITLRGNLEKYNEVLIKRIALSSNELELADANNKAGKAAADRLDKKEQAERILAQVQQEAVKIGGEYKEIIDNIVISSSDLSTKLEDTRSAILDNFRAQLKGGSAADQYAKALTFEGVTAGQVTEKINNLVNARDDETKATNAAK